MIRVLVVDDDEDVRLTVREFLTDEGYKVETAGSALAGGLALRGGTYDVVLLDLNLGAGKTGMDVVRDLVREGKILPSCIVLTASTPEAVNEILAFDPWLTNILFPKGVRVVFKPFRSIELLEAISAVMIQ